jgi:hypothetical protein
MGLHGVKFVFVGALFQFQGHTHAISASAEKRKGI